MLGSYLDIELTGFAALLARPAPAAYIAGRDGLVVSGRIVMDGACLDLHCFRVIAGASVSTACLEMGCSISRDVGSAGIADASHLLAIYWFIPSRRVLHPALVGLRYPVMHVFRLAGATLNASAVIVA